ncbi:MAG: TauD/TfdA family dioxygenase [Hyphomicrobiales bacterium]|nr:TauD/TfdA family dioxygenase [Hyphomicrobiales bacterium]
MSMTIRKLSDAVGAEITGAKVGAELSDADFNVIEDALHENLVIVIRDQNFTPEGFVAFSRRFGRPEPHVIDQFHHKADRNILTDIPQVALVGERLPSQPCVCNRDDAFLVMYDAPRGTLLYRDPARPVAPL